MTAGGSTEMRGGWWLAVGVLGVAAVVLSSACSDGGTTQESSLATMCGDYCAGLAARGCPGPDCESTCTRDLAACPASCFDELAATMDCKVNRTSCDADGGVDPGLACMAELAVLATCSPECG